MGSSSAAPRSSNHIHLIHIHFLKLFRKLAKMICRWFFELLSLWLNEMIRDSRQVGNLTLSPFIDTGASPLFPRRGAIWVATAGGEWCMVGERRDVHTKFFKERLHMWCSMASRLNKWMNRQTIIFQITVVASAQVLSSYSRTEALTWRTNLISVSIGSSIKCII